MLLSEVAQASIEIASTRSRKTKAEVITRLLRASTNEELPIVIGLLTGALRQGRIGIGWATVEAATKSTAPSQDPDEFSVSELDQIIGTLIDITGEGSTGQRSALLNATFRRCDQTSADYLSKLLTGELRQGSLEGIMIDGLATALGVDPKTLRRARTLNGDLGAIAVDVRLNGPEALSVDSIKVGRALEPMLAATSASVGEAIAELGMASVEWKLDGARMQVHKRGDEVWLFTRNLNDVTSRLPEIVEQVRNIPVFSLVADGEVLSVSLDGRPSRFQDTMSRFGSGDAVEAIREGKKHLRLFLFDVLHLNGVDTIDRPLVDRRELLQEHAADCLVPGEITDDPTVALRVAEEALALGHEGTMVKAAFSTYEAGRRGKSWRKVKPVKTLDLVVLAAEWGHGRRHGFLSNLHLGARGPVSPDGEPTFVMVGKTFKGLTDLLLAWQTTELLMRQVSQTGITVWVRPELVVEIALDGVLKSTTYPGGVALRFARVKGYRSDRAASTADDIDTVRRLLT